MTVNEHLEHLRQENLLEDDVDEAPTAAVKAIDVNWPFEHKEKPE